MVDIMFIVTPIDLMHELFEQETTPFCSYLLMFRKQNGFTIRHKLLIHLVCHLKDVFMMFHHEIQVFIGGKLPILQPAKKVPPSRVLEDNVGLFVRWTSYS